MYYRTVKRDCEILILLDQGMQPKEIKFQKQLSSAWVVYDALRRIRKNKIFYVKQLSKIYQIESLRILDTIA